MDRRGFLGALLSAAVLDPERLLWVPHKKLISIPKPRPIEVHEIELGFESIELVMARLDNWVKGRYTITAVIPPAERWWLKPEHRV